MSLEIRMRSARVKERPTVELIIENDGYYWFLHPWFERLRNQSGKYIDLYGDTVLTSDDWPRLRQILGEVEAVVRDRPKTWNVHVGTQTHPVYRDLYEPVLRQRLLAIITAFRDLIGLAERSGAQIECVGD